VLASLVGAGCSGTSTALGPRSNTDEAIVPVVLRNPAPSTLDVSLTVQFAQQTSQASLMTDVGLGFFSGGHPVQFAGGGERATCDGVDLPLKNRVAVFEVLHQVPLAQMAGATVHCDYATSGSDASVSLCIPPAPAFTSPPMGAQVVRSAQTVVTYRYDPATSTVFGLALAPSSAVPKANAQLNTPGPLQATVDTSSFAPDPGSLALWLSLTPQVTATGCPSSP
jgi:hypothetical protein